jgi:hypothetical protein
VTLVFTGVQVAWLLKHPATEAPTSQA